MGQSFSLAAIYGNLPIFNKQMKNFVKNLSEQIGKNEIDIREIVTVTTMEIFLESTLGTDIPFKDKKKYSHYLTKYDLNKI